MHVCLWDARGLGCAVYPICSYVRQEQDVFSIHFSSYIFRQGLSLNLALAVEAGWLVSWGSAFLCLSEANGHAWLFTWVLELKLRPSHCMKDTLPKHTSHPLLKFKTDIWHHGLVYGHNICLSSHFLDLFILFLSEVWGTKKECCSKELILKETWTSKCTQLCHLLNDHEKALAFVQEKKNCSKNMLSGKIHFIQRNKFI